jgi:hypothetical protein
MRLSEPIWHDCVAGSIAVLRNQRFDAVGIVAVERNAVRLITRAHVNSSVEPDAVPSERTIVRIRNQKIVKARKARLRLRRRGLSECGLLLGRQIGRTRAAGQESSGREKRDGGAGRPDQSLLRKRLMTAGIVATDSNAATDKSGPREEGACLSFSRARLAHTDSRPIDASAARRRDFHARSASIAPIDADPGSRQSQARCRLPESLQQIPNCEAGCPARKLTTT